MIEKKNLQYYLDEVNKYGFSTCLIACLDEIADALNREQFCVYNEVYIPELKDIDSSINSIACALENNND